MSELLIDKRWRVIRKIEGHGGVLVTCAMDADCTLAIEDYKGSIMSIPIDGVKELREWLNRMVPND